MDEPLNQSVVKQEFLKAFDEYGDAIFRFCVVKTSDPEFSADLTQETFTRYWQALREGKAMSNTRSFLYTIAGNLVIDWYRKKKPESLDVLADQGFEPADLAALDAEGYAEYAEVLRVLEDLPPEDRDVIVLRFVEGLEPRDIAEILGESANVVSVRINRAIKKVQRLLNTETVSK